MRQTPTDIVASLRQRCAAGGLDLVEPLQTGWYNASVAARHRLPDFGNPASLAVVIGNTRLLWREFLRAMAARPQFLEDPDPLDRYVERIVTQAAGELNASCHIRFAHRPEPDHIGMQQLAEAAGLAWRSPAMLSIHPRFGPWIGLRAAVVMPLPWSAARPAPAPPCESCRTGCLTQLELSRNDEWQTQLAVRDACPVGREFRYGDTQIAYHYTRSRDLLRAAVSRERRSD